MADQVAKWDVFELCLRAQVEGNPFEVDFRVHFHYRHRTVEVDGFYDGDGLFRARLMPDAEGQWRYTTASDVAALDGQQGTFTCAAAAPGSHGPVRVADSFHFAYADGTPYVPVGTTCYVWHHQTEALEEQTLATLKHSPFNKIRMCVFPKDYDYNRNEPEHYPFAGDPENGFDFSRFHPPFWHHLERRLHDLRQLGIEADLILFHPYDRWGFSTMGAEADESYLRYAVARLASCRNIWWSFANEYDLMRSKSVADWDRFMQQVQECDPSQHLRSIHNGRPLFDHGKPWITHCSIQHHEVQRVDRWRAAYRKPVVVDECSYEGNLHHGWGNITAPEMVHRFWEGFARGGYVGHGETYLHAEDVLWWSKGGVLHGDSPARIRFLRDVVEAAPAGLEPQPIVAGCACAGVEGEYYLAYFGPHQSAMKILNLPDGAQFQVEVIDAWEMTIGALDGTFSGRCEIPLPGKPYMAVRVVKVEAHA